MKKILVTLLMVVMVLSILAGCAAPAAPADEPADEPAVASDETDDQPAKEAADDDIAVAILFDFMSVETRVRQKANLEKLADEMGITLYFQSADANEKVQIQQAENVLSQGVDALVLLAQNADAAKPISGMCAEVDIPFIVTDRLVHDVNVDYFVGADNDIIGNSQVEYLLNEHPSGKWALIAGAPTDPNATLWHKDWMTHLQPYVDKGEIEIVADEKCENWDPNVALRHMENILTMNDDDIDVVLVMNDGLGNGVIQALEARDLAGKVYMSGLDGELVAMKRIAEGTQSMTLLYDDYEIPKAILETAVAAARGEKIETQGVVDNGFMEVPCVLSDLILVTKDTLPAVIEEGYADYDEIYADVPEAERP